MAMLQSDSSHHGFVENGPNEITQGRHGEAGQLGASWYFSRKEIEENSPSRRDGIDLKKESYLRRSYCSFLQDLGMKLKVPQVTIATAMVFCHRFYLRQSHAKNDRRTIATVCMFLAGKVEETPRPLKDVIMVSYEIIHKKDPAAGQRIKQREIYDKQKELILLGERAVLVTLGFDLNIHHAYKPLVEAIRRFNVGKNALPQVAWNFVNDGLRTSLCLQFEPHHIAAGAIFLATKFLKVKLPSDGDKVWWQEFDVTPRQLEEVSNQMLELYEQNREPSQANEAEGSSAGVRNQRSSVKFEGNSKEPSAHGYQQASKQANSRHTSSTVAPGHHDAEPTNPDKQISGCKVLQNDNGDHGGSKERSSQSGGRIDACMYSSHHDKRSLPGHQCSKSSYESDHRIEEHKPHRSHDNSNDTIDGILNGNEAPSASSSMMDAMNKIDKDKVKAALEKRRKSKGDVAVKANVMDDDDLLEGELEHGVELAIEVEKIKQDMSQNLSHGMHRGDNQNTDQVAENGHHGKHNVPTAAEDGEFPMGSKGQHSPQLAKQNDVLEHKSQQYHHTLKDHKGHDDGQLGGRYYKRPKLEG
ncbi:cyclin-T1-4-like isoform X2 [Phragmites australis]|uniref:cyclin-T1-4-like isoform X2 n=1 Tax=Phragmites australis TaxID=29695 RepID=UPI002D795D81|nr:cyclin-T1-4-like isoform X2 [Phragmites australis]